MTLAAILVVCFLSLGGPIGLSKSRIRPRRGRIRDLDTGSE